MSKIEVDAITQQSGTTLTTGGGASKTVVVDATTVTLGRCGGTVALASGASQTGFGRSGSVNWQTTPKTATFTAVDGEGYFINQGSQITANLPAGSAGAIVAFSDYARNFATYNLIISPNGSEKIGGTAQDAVLGVDGQSATFVYVDATKGWVNVQNAEDTETGVSPFIAATGGTITTCGNDKIHTFTGPGTFTVSKIATASPAPANNQVSYMVVAGGGAGGDAGDRGAGGGGAGGFREDKSPTTPYTSSPLEGAGAITVTATGFPIVVGGGGASSANPNVGGSGNVSTFSTITSAGGGGAGGEAATGSAKNGLSGGSGGGGGRGDCIGSGGSGNTPPVSPAQGKDGKPGEGPASSSASGGGGGGATACGTIGATNQGGAGGAGATTSINGTPTAFAGGGGGAVGGSPTGGVGAGGTGGGGAGGSFPGPAATAGTTNTGGGGGGASDNGGGATGGSGIVIIRYKFQ